MAILAYDDLSLEFNYVRLADDEDEWTKYEIYFKWKGEPLVRDDLLKRQGPYWNARREGSFLANEHGGDILPFLKSVLESDRPDYWEPIEPDICVAVYPNTYFPFLPSHWRSTGISGERGNGSDEMKRLKAEGEELPDDSFTVMVKVDAYNLKEADAYYGAGLCLHLVVHRCELERFVNDLEREFIAASAANNR